ncbi:hypothetical protein [Weissella viridescens]|uniref:hypothetical protein n=1 Tax=Weissella viridescens TaxID=1629 RepID=UPI003AF29CF2
MTNQTEIASVPVTDTYGILPITNELLIVLTYEGKNSDHVSDALAQFEAQAIDLSHSLGGELTNLFNEAEQSLNQAKTERLTIRLDILDDANSFAQKAFNQLHVLFQADDLDVGQTLKQLHYLLTSFKALAKLDNLDQATMQEMQDELQRLTSSIDDATILGTVKVNVGHDSYMRKERYEDILDYIEQCYYCLTEPVDETSLSEQLEQQKTEFQWDPDEDSFIEALDSTLDHLNSEAQLKEYDADKIRELIELIDDALTTYKDTYGDGQDDALLSQINDNLTLLSRALDNPNKLGVARTYNGSTTKIRKATLHDLTENISEDIGFLTHAE